MKASHILSVEPGADYELLDSGEGEKFERFGAFTLVRPDPQALWKKKDASAWKKTDGSFAREEKKAEWTLSKDLPDRWEISFGGLKLWIKPTAFKHVGIFPEQERNWEWLRQTIESAKSAVSADANGVEVLNLFGYTGGASLACAQAGAKVVHVDGSKVALAWARDNAALSGLETKPIRWILDDVRAFVRREVKRGRKYQGIIMDPPSFGHGPENELWKIEDHFLPLIEECMSLLADQPLFFLINGYSAGYSAIAYENNLLPLVAKFGGTIEIGELTVKESAGTSSVSVQPQRLLPCGIFARWSK